MTSFLVFLAIIAAIVFWAISIYNRLINERNRVRNAFAQIDVQLTRRYDLIPNLIEAVKGYMKHEKETLEAVINARNAAQQSLAAAKADAEKAGVACSTHLLIRGNSAGEDIVDFAAAKAVDLIVVGVRRRSRPGSRRSHRVTPTINSKAMTLNSSNWSYASTSRKEADSPAPTSRVPIRYTIPAIAVTGT